MARRASYTNEDNLYSITIGNNSSQSSLPAYRRLSQSRVSPAAPYPPSKPTRRPAHTSQPTATLSSTRRGSLPALHLHTSPQSTHTVSIAPSDMQENSENLNDTLYSHHNLATFSFGAPTVHHDTDSPLSVQAPSESGHSYSTGSTDRTPRPSISHPRESGDSGGEDEPRRIRKMRAIDDGGRRPSLPTNRYTLDRPGSDNSAGPSRSNPETSGSDSEPIASGSTSDIDLDPGNESGVVDTDVELEGIAPDDASQHTFGLEQYDWYVVDPNERRQEAGSPVTFANVGSDDDDDSDVSETGTRALAAMRRSSIAIRMASTRNRSFHAGDPDLVSAQSNARQREDSTTTVRRSSYSDTEGGASIAATSSNRDQQPPLPPANWNMFTNNAGISPIDDSGERVYQGMDLGYIMNVDLEGLNTRRSSLSFIAPQSLPLPPAKDKRKSKDKEKRKKEKGKGEDFDVSVMRGLIGSPSNSSNLLDVAPWAEAEDGATGLRRPSTVTLDDSFAGGLRRDDPDYALRRNKWSFIRVREHLSLPPRELDGNPRLWDVWRCSQIGQIRIERATLPPSDPNKPNQQRLNAEHDVDPDSANTFGGPTTVVHRHSRALAFSIYRHYSLRNYRSGRTRNSTATVSTRTPRSSETRTLVMPTHDGILLATKRVQEQFTTTKSTVKLDTHGLLPEEGDNRRDARREPNLTHPRRAPQAWSASSPQRELPATRHIVDLSRLEGLGSQTSSTRGASTSHISGSSLNLSGVTAFASSASTSQSISSTASIMTSSESSISERQLTPHDEADEDSDNEPVNPVSRSSHPEAFATLDKRAIDQLKNEQVSAAARRSPSWFHRFIGPTGSNTPRAVLSSLAPIEPPWLTLAPRSMQEEQDRAIQGLRLSFKDVGLVPSTRSKGGAGIGRKGKGKNKDMLTQVPDDSLYMLLPLWPHETDPASAAREQRQRTPRVLDQEQNLYLLVYYVPFEKQGEGNPAKKRSRSRPRKGERERQHPTPLFDARCGFKVIGRLISHSDLNGSGIRLPVRGLSVTGPLAEAELGIPPASLRDEHTDDFVIGVCLDRRGTIEFVPEGLEKLGLCVRRTESVQIHTHPGMQTADPVDEVIVLQPLTAVGRAAVEVAWLGCMALMTFYGPQSQGPA